MGDLAASCMLRSLEQRYGHRYFRNPLYISSCAFASGNRVMYRVCHCHAILPCIVYVFLYLTCLWICVEGRRAPATQSTHRRTQPRSVQKRGNDDLLHAWTPRACGMHLHARTRVSDAFQAVNRTVGKLCIQGTHAAIDSGTKLSDIVAALHGHS